ncbi:BgiBFReM4 [Biomphalaria glabrata]|nr:BgiBFReM4 [Biomphalaria glabrata]
MVGFGLTTALTMLCLTAVLSVVDGQSFKMKVDLLCRVQERLGKNCFIPDGVMTRSSVLGCARRCVQYAECVGFVLDGDKMCYLMQHCYNISGQCVEGDEHYTFYKRWPTKEDCLNGGLWDAQSQSCSCSGGFVGPRCERYAISCRDLYDNGYGLMERTRTLLKPPGYSAPFYTNCAILRDEIRTDVVHQTPSVGINNSRSWAEYVDGYYASDDTEVARDLWLGLEKMRHFNQVCGLTTLVLILSFKNESLDVAFHYFKLNVGGADVNYKITYYDVAITNGDQSGVTFKNCLPYGAFFSTPDADNDKDPTVHCGKTAGAGWWFSTCSPYVTCNPLGVPYETGQEALSDTRMRFDGYDIRNLATEFQHLIMYFSEN